MALSRRKEVVTKQVDEINYEDLSEAVEALLTEREGRPVDIRDYAGQNNAQRKAFEETNKLGDMSWYSTRFDQFTELQKQQHAIYESYTKGIPYWDFWHWWLDHIDSDVSNDTTNEIMWDDAYTYELQKLEEELEACDSEEDRKMIEFHITVLKAFNEVLLTIYTQEELSSDSIQINYSW